MQKLIITFFLLTSVANSQEEQTLEVIDMQELKNKIYDDRVSVYLHPLTLIFSVGNFIEDRNRMDIVLYATVEVPLSLSSSLIIRPSYWYNPDNIRLGSDIGIRYYTKEKGKGNYLQGLMSFPLF